MASTSSDKEDSNSGIRDDESKSKHILGPDKTAKDEIGQHKASSPFHTFDKLASNHDNKLDGQEQMKTNQLLNCDDQSKFLSTPSESNKLLRNILASNDDKGNTDIKIVEEEEEEETESQTEETPDSSSARLADTNSTITKHSSDQPGCSNGQQKQDEEFTAKNENEVENFMFSKNSIVSVKSARVNNKMVEMIRMCRNANKSVGKGVVNCRTMCFVCRNPIEVKSERESDVCVNLPNSFASVTPSEENNGGDEDEYEEDEECEDVGDEIVDRIENDEILETSDKSDEGIEFEPLNEHLNHNLMAELDEVENGSWSEANDNQIKRKSDIERDGVDQPLGKKLCLTNSANGSLTSSDSCSTTNHLDLSEPHERIPSAINLKKRIPTKDNPPPELAAWLDIFQRWGNAERLMAVDQLIDLCEPTQVRHMMSVIEPQFQRDFISLLPKELALYVLSFLEPKDLLKAAQTCRYWRILAEDNLLWREKCREANVEIREVFSKRRVKATFPSPSPWKAAFMRQHNIEMNWRYRPIRAPKVLKGHDDHVITCLQFSGSRIVSGSDDNTLKVWSAITGKCLKTLVGHTGGVWSSQMAGNIIVSGSTDRTLKVWSADTGNCLHTLYGHTSTVRCMHLHKNKVVSGSRDATLRLWDITTGQCLHVLVGHVAAVRCVQYNGRLVVSGAYDYVVKVWNPETEECLHTLQGHTSRVYSLQFDGIHVVSGSLDTSIRVWDVESGACKHTLMGHQSLTSGMELKNNILVSGNADSTVKVWDILTGQCLQTLSGTNKHNSAVTCLQFNSKFVITSSDDGTVKLWDLKTGEFIRNLVALESGGSGGVVWRIRASPTKLVCAVGSRNGTEETKLLVLNFDVDVKS